MGYSSNEFEEEKIIKCVELNQALSENKFTYIHINCSLLRNFVNSPEGHVLFKHTKSNI